MSIVVATLTAVTTFADNYHVSAAVGNDTNDGLSWAGSLKTIATAVTKAGNGDTILVTNGTYAITAQISLTNAVTLASVNGRAVTGIVGTDTFRLLYLNHPDALVSGFAISKGRADKVLQGGGLMIDTRGGTVQDCRVTECFGVFNGLTGSAIHQVAGKVSRCLIDNNRFGYNQSGTVSLSGGLIENCVIANNKMHHDGAGLYLEGGIARNCTIVGNESSRNGCGVFRSGAARIENCIVWGNIHRTNPTLVSRNIHGATAGTVTNCCTPEAVGTGGVTDEPRFIDAANGDYRLQASSLCINVGATALNTADTDYSGATRISGTDIDIGAFEFNTASFACGLRATPAQGLAPLETTLIPTVYGTSTDANLLELVWRITDGVSDPLVISNTGLQSLSRTLDAGFYTVTLEVTDPAIPETTVSVIPNAVVVSPDTLYVVENNPNARAPYATWETAATNLHETLSLAWDGTTIIVSNGTYAITRQLIFDRAITMASVNGLDTTMIQAPKVTGVRVLTLSHADARVEGFTLRDGRGGTGNPGGGVLVGPAGGSLFNCRITDNTSSGYDGFGGGACIDGGRVSNCLIDNNKIATDSSRGCGVYQTAGILENSLILTNKTYSLTQTTGGGVNLNGSGVVRNCTIVGNTAKTGGGIARSAGTSLIQNCIIVDNATGADTGDGAPNWYNAWAPGLAYQNVCTPVSVGTGCITAGPEFVDVAANNYQLRLGSPCIDAGKLLEGLPETDLAGNPRVAGAGLDIGAYEYDTRLLSCGILASPAKALTVAEVTLTASFTGFTSDASDLQFDWVLDDVAGTPVQSGLGLSVVQYTYDTYGRYSVRLTVSEPSSGKSVVTVLTNAVHIAPVTLYLTRSNTVPVMPYDTWAKAATNIHEVVAEAINGSTVLISNGTYEVTQTIDLTSGASLRGINGWAETTLKGNKVDGVRILDIDHIDAVVEGLTIRGGKTASIGLGGGVNITDGTLKHCLITDNAAAAYSRGTGINQLGGLVSACIISNNAACESGGGIAIQGGITENSLVTASKARYGGGVQIAGGVMRNCTITGNAATDTDPDGITTKGGGGVWREGGSVVNCIIWGNTAKNLVTPGYPDWSGAHATAYSNNCTSVEVGANCVVEDPLFRNPTQHDYRIASNSPCRDQGLYQNWMAGATDLWGNPRVDNKHFVDIGAHEVAAPPPTVILVR